MACPHSSSAGSSPQTCSLCASATPKIITRDPATGGLLVDGKPKEHIYRAPSYGRPPRIARSKPGRPSKAVQALRVKESIREDDVG